ncbi:hypothetical protein [Kingella oralis]|uniref:hypothetical protein n=1 Tax=Kingella oralis TaxID=505 RepID=UPI0034E386F0
MRRGENEFSGCLSLIFRPRRRFAAYHEQGQAPAPHAHPTLLNLLYHFIAQTQRQPENGNGTATARRQMSYPTGWYWLEEMSASRPRSIGCKFCKGFNLSDKNRLAEHQTVLYFQAASNGVRSKRHTLQGLRQPENGLVVLQLVNGNKLLRLLRRKLD